MTSIRVENLCKSYKVRPPNASFGARRVEKRVLHDVTFDVSEGEVLGIIGRNGAGKSTLLKILSRITRPTSGRAVVAGRVASLLEVGTGMHPEMTGRENIVLNGALLGMPRKNIDARFDEIIEFAGVHDYMDVPIKHYSTGMKLRLAFAVAAHLSAEVMIVDEVLAVGDAEFQAKCLGVLHEGTRSGRTTLFVSHNMAAIEGLCTRVIWLGAGRIEGEGRPDEVVRAYLSASTQAAGESSAFAPALRDDDKAVTIKRATVGAPDGGQVTQGDDIVIVVELEVRRHVRGLMLFLAIRTLEGQSICSLSNGDYGGEWNLEPGAHTITVRLRDVRLLPRVHTVSLRTGLAWGTEVFEDHQDALTFTVQARDVLGAGISINADRGVTWIPATYEVAATEAIEVAHRGRD